MREDSERCGRMVNGAGGWMVRGAGGRGEVQEDGERCGGEMEICAGGL